MMNSTKLVTERKIPLKILIIEAFTDANVGSCALVENSYKILQTIYKCSEIRVMAQYPKAFTDLYGIFGHEDIFVYPAQQPLTRQLLWLSKTGSWMLWTIMIILAIPQKIIESTFLRRLLGKLEPFIWADLIVSVGAERLNDKYYKNGPFSWYTLLIAKLMKKKVVIFPQL